MKYTKTAISSALMLLDQINTSGIENAKRIVLISNILKNPIAEKEDDDGNDSKEE